MVCEGQEAIFGDGLTREDLHMFRCLDDFLKHSMLIHRVETHCEFSGLNEI